MGIYFMSVGEGQAATIVEATPVLAKQVLIAATLFGWASNFLDGKIVLLGVTYPAAEGACAF
jgi:hypothetical protein